MTNRTHPLPVIALALGLGIGPALSETAERRECRTLTSGDIFCKVPHESGTGFRWVLQGKLRAEFDVGDPFPVYEHSMLMNLRRYRLPPVDGPWRYYRLNGVIYKVSSETHEVIEIMGRAFRK